MITELTEEQRALLPVYADKWIKIGLSTEPADKERAERGIRGYYRVAQREEPNQIIWCSSPKEGVELLKSYGVSWTQYLGGSFWAAWPAAHGDYVQSVLGVDCGEALQAAIDVAASCCWWWALDDRAVATDRPAEVHLDLEGRLHSQEGLAIKWRDGWGLAAWHGTVISKEWVPPGPGPKVEDAFKNDNLERRRCAAEILGWAKVLAGVEHRVIDEDKDPSIGTLIEVDLPDSPRSRFMKVLCATGRTFCTPTDPQAKTAVEGQAALWEETPEEYIRKMREVRT
jgi:hypothetical protein